jgi:hypothetical protein
MDTTTKMMFVVNKDVEFGKAMYVLSSIMSGNQSKKVQKIAKNLEFTFNNYWNENTWLKMFAGSTSLDEEWMSSIRKYIESEFLEKE